MKLLVEKMYRTSTRPCREDLLRKNVIANPNPRNFLEQLAVDPQLNPFTKWWHYLSFYNEKLGHLAHDSREGKRPEPIRILELGVWQGGSLDLWREFFGPEAVIFGIDIVDPGRIIKGGELRIGSQIDSKFLASVVEEMGGIDVVIDDGSHMSQHVVKSFEILYPMLNPGGRYFIEDLHTSYWPNYGGGLRRKNSSIEYLKHLVDYLNSEYFQKNVKLIESEKISRPKSVEFADSLVLVKKGKETHPELFFGGESN